MAATQSLTTAKRLPVLLYHHVMHPENEWEARLSVSPDLFKSQMQHLASKGMRACTLGEFKQWMEGAIRLPVGSFLLTFDDGYLDVYEQAFPVLRALGWTATTFLISHFIGKTDGWCRSENPSGRSHALMNREQIGEMLAHGFSFQSHTRTHPFLTRTSDTELMSELRGSREDLEGLLGEEVPCIAYPYGRIDDRVVDTSRRSGYRMAFTCKPGLNTTAGDPMRIRRIEVFGSDRPSVLARKMRFGTNVGTLSEAIRYYPVNIAQKAAIRLSGQ